MDNQDPQDLWKQEADADGSHKTWYKKAVDYWDGQDASYNGVLVGGYYCMCMHACSKREHA